LFGYNYAFFGIVRTPVIRGGVDDKFVDGNHTFLAVYTEMFLQISMDYNSLPDPRTLTASEIRFYFNGLREGLKSHTKPGA
jgi:hypothetical protein